MRTILKTICCIGFIIMASSCSKTADDIPLKNIDEHRKYQAEKIIGREIKDEISDDERNRINNGEIPADLVNEYRQILNKNPKSEEALYLFSQVINNNQKIKLIDKSLTINPKFYYSIVAKGKFYESKGFYDKSGEAYMEAIKLNPKNNLAYAFLTNQSTALWNAFSNVVGSRSLIIKLLSESKTSLIKCSSNWEFSQPWINKEINLINLRLNELNKQIKLEEERIKLEEKLCSQHEHEEFLRIAFQGLGKSIYQINLMSKNGCSYGWYVLAYNKYGGISTCQILTTPNYETGEIECKSVSCDD